MAFVTGERVEVLFSWKSEQTETAANESEQVDFLILGSLLAHSRPHTLSFHLNYVSIKACVCVRARVCLRASNILPTVSSGSAPAAGNAPDRHFECV